MKLSSKASRLVREFDRAAQTYEIIGAMDPEDWPEITKNYRDTKRALRRYIAELESKI